MQKLTNDEISKDTNSKKIDNNTEEKSSQTVMENQECMMLIPLNTSLTIIGPTFIKKFRNSKIIKLAVIYILSLLIVAFSFCQILRITRQKNKTLELMAQVSNYITEANNSDIQENEEHAVSDNRYVVDFDSLKKINPDTKSWLIVNGIGIDFPIVQGTNNEYYLKHSLDKSYNVCGWAFLDYRNKLDGTDKNMIIYGHNRRDGTMFSSMTKILEPDWYNNEENNYITFITEEGEVTYEVFSVYQVKVEDYYIQTNFNSDEEYQGFLKTLKSRSIKNYNVDLTTEDKILTISTCGNENKYRIVLHAKKI